MILYCMEEVLVPDTLASGIEQREDDTLRDAYARYMEQCCHE
jgi:hypothetical protein